jgi:deoxycytidine triphosphate deaminase
MFLGKAELLRRIKLEGLLEKLNPGSVQGAGVDLRIERLYEPVTEASLHQKGRKLPGLREIRGNPFILKPGIYYLCTTREEVNMPKDLVAFILPRSTLFRCGVSLRTAVVDPGYSGILTIGIKNEGPHDFILEKGSRICQIVFSKVYGEAQGYEGRYQGGKIR